MKIFIFLCIVGFALCCSRTVRSFDGSCNNQNNPNWGKSGIPLAFDEGQEFKDGISERVDGPNERVVSNLVEADTNYGNPRFWTTQFRVTGPTPNRFKLNNLFATFIQFFSHDLSLSPLIFTGQGFADNFLIRMVNDSSDPLYNPGMNPPRIGLFARPSFGVIDGTFKAFNNNTAWLDGSQIYGSTDRIANGLRLLVDGKLKVGPNNTVPLLGATLSTNECGSFVDRTSGAGDFRSDVTVGVTSLHSLYVREHNRLADKIKNQNPSWTDEQIFQKARALVIASYQKVVFDEALPLLLGPDVRLGRFQYNANSNPNILNSFSSSAFRIVHDIINNPFIALLDNCTSLTFPVVPGTPFPPFLPEWERPSCVFDFWRATIREFGDEPFIWGMLHQFAQDFDNKVTDLLRNVFFSPSGISAPGNLDIEASNIFRNRFNGVPNYDALRKYWRGKSVYQLPGCSSAATVDSLTCWRYVTKNNSLASILRNLYGKVNKLDSYIGFLVEDKDGGRMSPTATAIIVEQMKRVRDGDWFWYENQRNGLLTAAELREVNKDSFAKLIKRNFELPSYPKRAFEVLDDRSSCFPRRNEDDDDDDDDDHDDDD